jgi:hypothetical protein
MRAIIPAALLGFALSVTAAGADKDKPAGGVTVDKDKKSVAIDATVAPRKLEHLKETYPIEVVACWPHPKGKKSHETVVTIEAKPSEVHKALEQLGLKPGKPTFGDAKEAAEGPELNVFIEVPGEDGKPKRLTMDKVLLDPKTNKPLPKGVKFRFTGSVMSQPDPTKPEKAYGADLSGTLIAMYPVTNETVVQTSLTMKDEKYLKLDTNKTTLPKEGTAVKLILEAVGR